MKYYLHDTNSFNDEKITMLFMEYGYEGIGLFYTLLEKIGFQEKPIRTDVLKRQLRVGKKLEKCWSFMEEIGIISSNNGETFNERILSYSETYQIKKEKTRAKVSQWRENQANIKTVTSYVPVSNPPKVNESKVKESKENVTDESETPPINENLLIPILSEIFKKANSSYVQQKERDFKPLFEIAKFLCAAEKIDFNLKDPTAIEKIKNNWAIISDFISKDPFYKTFNLLLIEKHIQSIVQKIQHGTGTTTNGSKGSPVTGQQLNEAHAKYFG